MKGNAERALGRASGSSLRTWPHILVQGCALAMLLAVPAACSSRAKVGDPETGLLPSIR